jgi:hypothetical protein
VDPIVVVIIEEPLVTVEMIVDVVMAEEEVVVGTVIVDVYDMYFPVGVACSLVPVTIVKPVLEELERELESELEVDVN